MIILNYAAGIGTAVLDFLDKYNGAVTAVATAFIALITIVLARVTGKQARLTTAALDLARQEFVATHRPRVILRYIEGPFRNDQGQQFICLSFVNVGANKATIEAFGADLATRNDDAETWEIPGLDATPTEISSVTLTCGQRHVLTVTARTAVTGMQIFREATRDHQLCAVGIIRYRDDNGVSRDTGFFRVLDVDGKHFVLSNRDSEMEYQD